MPKGYFIRQNVSEMFLGVDGRTRYDWSPVSGVPGLFRGIPSIRYLNHDADCAAKRV